MKTAIGFFRKTLIGGVLFLLPLGIVIFVFGELFDISENFADKVQETVLPSADSPLVPLLIAVGTLVAVAFIAGLFATTNLGRRTFQRAERIGGSVVPGYSVIRQMVADVSGGADLLAGNQEVIVVKLEVGGVSRFGFLVDRTKSGDLVVFLPGAPTVLSGTVVVAPAQQVTETSIRSSDLMETMQRLGNGLGDLGSSGAEETGRGMPDATS